MAAPVVAAPTPVRPDGQRPRPGGRILIVLENVPVSMDNRVAKQLRALLANGYRVWVITQRHPGNEAYRRVPGLRLAEYAPPREPRSAVGYLAEYGYSLLMASMWSIRILARERIDIVQFCQPPDLYFLLAPLFKSARVRVVVDQRDLLPELYVARYGSRNARLLRVVELFERFGQRAADEILCVNAYLRNRALVASGLAGDHVTVVRNGPVAALVQQAKHDPSRKAGARYMCCWVGQMGRQDRLDLLVRSVHHVVHELGRKDCRFALIGDGECLAEARALARELDLTEWVEFAGFLPQDEVFRYLATADLGVDASLQAEVSPVKAMEYMAFGLPFVAFDLPETRAIGDGAAAFAEPGDVAAHARAIDALLADPERRRQLGAGGMRRVREELAWEHQAAAYLGVLDRLCQGRTGARSRGAGPHTFRRMGRVQSAAH
jgi:glycosyltransferase involved in cell wall biosynthesis